MKKISNFKSLVKTLAGLAKSTAAMEKSAKARGLFVNDRELLECPAAWRRT
ncbi:MAG: hypothetical protein AAB359_08250 [Elusimicrobiota bacterium]